MKLLTDAEIKSKLTEFSDWQYVNKQIIKEFTFKNFREALAFVNKAGNAAEELDHHPDILLHSWNRVKISVTTHSEGGVTLKDFQLAGELEEK